jgi:hypothetical protein
MTHPQTDSLDLLGRHRQALQALQAQAAAAQTLLTLPDNLTARREARGALKHAQATMSVFRRECQTVISLAGYFRISIPDLDDARLIEMLRLAGAEI